MLFSRSIVKLIISFFLWSAHFQYHHHLIFNINIIQGAAALSSTSVAVVHGCGRSHPPPRVSSLSISSSSFTTKKPQPTTTTTVTSTAKYSSSTTNAASLNANESDDNDDTTTTPDPVDSAQILNSMMPRSTIQQLSKRSDKQGFLQLLFHFTTLIISSSFVVAQQQQTVLWRVLLSLLPLSFVSSFYFHGLHETVHNTAFATRIWNKIFKHVFGFLCFRPAHHYYYYHWQHHKHTGDPKLDSELCQTNSFLDFPIHNLPTYFMYLTGIPFWIDAIFSTLLQHALGKCHDKNYLQVSPKAANEVTREARIYLSLYVVVIGLASSLSQLPLQSMLLTYWILPAFLGQPFLRFYLLAEHRGMKHNTNNVLETTRTVSTRNWLIRRLAWCMPYHREHHAWPSIPFWQLHRIHEKLLLVQEQEQEQEQQQLLHQEADKYKISSSCGDQLYPAVSKTMECTSYIDFNRVFILSLLQRSKSKQTVN